MLADRIIIGIIAAALALFPPLAAAQSVIGSFPPGVFQSRAAIDASGGLPGPPTCTYQAGTNSGTNAAGVVTYSSFAIGTASATRQVIVLIASATTGGLPAITGAVFGGSITATVTNLTSTSTNDITIDVITAPIPTGTTDSLVVTYNRTISTPGQAAVYTVDNSTLSSTTPSVGGGTVTSSTSMTETVNIANSGTCVLAEFTGFGISNGTQAFAAPNDPTVVKDSNFGAQLWGHANSVAANASSRVSVSWTTSAEGILGIAAFR